MPRGRKKITETLEEQLESMQIEIDKATESLRTLKTKRKVIESKIEEKKKEKLYQAVMESGKDIDEILAAMSSEQ